MRPQAEAPRFIRRPGHACEMLMWATIAGDGETDARKLLNQVRGLSTIALVTLPIYARVVFSNAAQLSPFVAGNVVFHCAEL